MFTEGDVNGDGNPDVAVIPYERDIRDAKKRLGVTVLLGDGKGHLASMRGSPFSLTGCRGPARVAIGNIAGDANRDGMRDMAVLCAQNDRLFFFIGTRNGSFDRFARSIPTG